MLSAVSGIGDRGGRSVAPPPLRVSLLVALSQVKRKEGNGRLECTKGEEAGSGPVKLSLVHPPPQGVGFFSVRACICACVASLHQKTARETGAIYSRKVLRTTQCGWNFARLYQRKQMGTTDRSNCNSNSNNNNKTWSCCRSSDPAG